MGFTSRKIPSALLFRSQGRCEANDPLFFWQQKFYPINERLLFLFLPCSSYVSRPRTRLKHQPRRQRPLSQSSLRLHRISFFSFLTDSSYTLFLRRFNLLGALSSRSPQFITAFNNLVGLRPLLGFFLTTDNVSLFVFFRIGRRRIAHDGTKYVFAINVWKER